MMRFLCTLQQCERCLETYLNYVWKPDTAGGTVVTRHASSDFCHLVGTNPPVRRRSDPRESDDDDPAGTIGSSDDRCQFEVRASSPRQAGSNQGCGIRKCATTVRIRITGTAKTTLRHIPANRWFAGGRSSSPTMTVASSAKRMPAPISDARTVNSCGGHTAGRLAAQAQPGRAGCAIHSTSKPRRTTPAATTGERVAPCVVMGMSTGYRSGTPARRPRHRARRNGRHASVIEDGCRETSRTPSPEDGASFIVAGRHEWPRGSAHRVAFC